MPELHILQTAILAYLAVVDPKREIVDIDPLARSIRFKEPITCHQKPKYEKEGYVRAYLVAKLIRELGYPADCIGIETDITVSVGRSKRSKGKDRGRNDVAIYQRGGRKESLFLGIECKWPDDFTAGKKDLDGQLWGITKAKEIEKRVSKRIHYLTLYTCELKDAGLADKCLVIDYPAAPTYQDWKDAGEPAAEMLPSHYGDAPRNRYANVSAPTKDLRPLNRTLGPQDFAKLRDELHNLLWAGASADDNAIFDQLVKLFLIKIYDELTTSSGKSYQFQITVTATGDEPAGALANRFSRLYEKAARDFLNYDDKKLADAPFKSRGITDDKIRVAVRGLQGVSLTENVSTASGFDLLGSFFEGILAARY